MFMACVMLAASLLVAVFPVPQAAGSSSRSTGTGKKLLEFLRLVPSEGHDIEHADKAASKSSSC